MDDLISRQAAIYAVAELASSMSVCISVDECHGMKRMQGMAVRALDDLPSTQHEIIRCKECKWFCEMIHQCGRQIAALMFENDYCSYAERRDNDE